MEIYFNDTSIDLDISDNSYRYRVIMGENSLTVYFSLPEHLEIPKGAYCFYQAEKFTSRKSAAVTQKAVRYYEYTLLMESEEYKTRQYKLRNPVDRRLKFSYTAKPREFAQLIVDNLNTRDSGWTVGECIDAPEICISFNHQYISEALKTVVDVLKTEYEFANKTLHLRKVEHNKDNPFVLSYGHGGGFKTGIKRDNSDESEPVEVLFVQGGEKNIDPSKYGNRELLLPKNQQLEYEGRTYVTDADGYSICRADKKLQTGEEDSLDCSNISPQRVGIVSNLIVTNTDKHFYDFVDKDIPENLDYNKYTIKGEKLTVIFQSGMLAGEGKVFEVIYKHKDRKFEIVPQDIDGVTMPDNIFKPVIGDKYAVFGCMLPDEYICDNATKTGASWEMFKEGVKFLYENEDPRFSFTGELDGIWTKKDWLNIGGKIVLGGYTKFTASFVPDGILIRIKGIKDFLNKPHSPVIELSNTTASAGVSGELEKIGQNEVVAEDNKRELISFTKRRFRDAEETAKMLENSLLNFSGAISPVSVNAMQMIVGDKSLQFMFVTAKNSIQQVPHEVKFDTSTKILTAQAGVLKHMTLGITSLSSSHKPEEYKYWDIEPFTSPVLTNTQAYYLYAKVVSSGSTGVFYISPTAIKMDAESDNYYLMVGILNSEFNDERSWAQFYGFSEWTPGQMLIERIISPDGNNYLDFVRNAFRVGNDKSYLDWNNLEADTLSTLKMKLQDAVIKNRLDVLGEAFLAGFLFSNEVIKSSANVGNNPAMLLDGKYGRIRLESERSGGDYSQANNQGTKITIDSGNGIIETRSKSNSGRVAYMSPTGVFCNNAETLAVSSCLGVTKKAAIVGLGFGNVNKSQWDNENFIAGVYGYSSNEGTAPAYGGFFQNLMAAGLILNVRAVEEKAAATYLSVNDSLVIGYSRNQQIVYLPTDGVMGRTIFFKQWWSGYMRVYATGGQHLYDDSSENESFDVDAGQGAIFTFTVGYINGVKTEAWLFNKYKW